MRIGFFDSGIGGLTVLKEALRILPSADYIYYADTAHVPYGTKTKDEVRNYIFEAVNFISKQKVNALVIACNTATSITIGDLRCKFGFPIIGMEPAVKPAVEKSRDKRVLVTATPLTLKEEKFHNLVSRVDSEHKVDLLPLPGLVDFAEKFEFKKEKIMSYLNKELMQFDITQYETVVLGCTHFTFYKSYFKEIFPTNVDIIDGNIGTVKHMKCILDENRSGDIDTGNGQITYYSSGIKDCNDSRYKKYLELLD